MQKLTLTRPDDFHLHLRDGADLESVIADTACRFARAVVMPNLKPPVTSVAAATAYRERILAALKGRFDFQPLMTLYLTEKTNPEEIRRAAAGDAVIGVKLYPAGTTTHSDEGVSDVSKTYPVLEIMSESGLPLLVHGEATEPDIDIFRREAVYIERVLAPLVERFDKLKVVLEHVSSREGVEFVRQGPDRLAATITVHHLLYDRNDLFRGGLRPHFYCRPVLKEKEHREVLLEAATSGHPRFFLGTDSAPHGRRAKECECGAAGIYSAHGALEFCAQVFEDCGHLDRLESFASAHGAAFYGLPRNRGEITLMRESWSVPKTLPYGSGEIVPMAAGETCRWRLAS